MPLHVHRSTDLHALADLLAAHLDASWPDPFVPVPVAVGSRGMERWLRHELATRCDVVSNVVFPMLRNALEGATRALLDGDADGSWWEADADSPWRPAAVAMRLVPLLRARLSDPDFATVAGYLRSLGDVSHRELAFARQVADVLDRMARDRTATLLAWARHPASAGACRWLAELAAELRMAEADTPAGRFERLDASAGALVFRMFGPSFLTNGERARLRAIGRVAEAHVYAWSAWEPGRGTNPVAVSLGAPLVSLDCLPGQHWIDASSTIADTTLSRLQRRVRSSAPPSPYVDDGSLGFHAAHGALREVEVLRDTLLRAFHGGELEPREVLVMTPDLGTYAPLVASIFAQDMGGPPRIPVAIADLGLRRTNPVAATLLVVAEMLEDRVTAPGISALLALPPLRQRFGLVPDDLPKLEALMTGAGIFWGLDGADRARTGQPAAEANTFGAGAERVALGVLDEAGLDDVAAVGKDLRLAGVVVSVVRALEDLRARSSGSRTAREWRGVLVDIVDAFAPASEGWLRAEVLAVLDELVETGEALGELRVDAAAIRRSLQGRFEIRQGGDRRITGAVTMSELQPMRGVPYRFVALLGMGDGAFPRGGAPRAWDPFAVPEEGELDPRAIDRGLLLEAIMGATERLHVSWPGFDATTGAKLAACVPVEELLAAVGAEPVRHRVQPWAHDPALPSYDAVLRTRGAAASAAEGLDVLPPEARWREVAIADLQQDLGRPQRALLYGRLRIYLEKDKPPEALPEHEPIGLPADPAWIARALAEGSAEALVRRLRAEGAMPPGAEEGVARAAEAAEALRVARGRVAGVAAAAPVVVVEVAGSRVFGRAPAARERDGALVLEWFQASPAWDSQFLEMWVYLVAARAAGLPVEGAVLLDPHWEDWRPRFTFLAAPEHARDTLADLLEVRRLARTRPVKLFQRVSWAIAKDAVEGAVARAWTRDRSFDPYVRTLFGDWDPVGELGCTERDGLRDLASRVWEPVFTAMSAGDRAGWIGR